MLPDAEVRLSPVWEDDAVMSRCAGFTMSCHLDKFLLWLQYLKWTFVWPAERGKGGGGGMLIFSDKNTNMAVFSVGEMLDFALPCLVVGMGANRAASLLISLTTALWSGSWLGEGMKSLGTNNDVPETISAVEQPRSFLGVVVMARRTKVRSETNQECLG